MKFTDEDVIKALECCSEPSTKTCKELQCPLNEKCERNLDSLERFALDLIKRQKAEIERLETIIRDQEDEIEYLKIAQNAIRHSAIKEFAERLKSEFEIKPHYDKLTIQIGNIIRDAIDNLVKETVGE